ncbi:MAG: SIS domain-containing protein, partial [Firmicutes bacterium]|nr:SIS domain-containing protein [Bacillota bacterium]
TAFLNDCNEKMLFAQLINALGVEGDILLAISTSGNAKNVIYAAQVAKAKGMKVIALTGSTGGKLKSVCNVLLNVPNDITYQIQELHLPLYHLLCLALENEMFGI